MEKGNHYSFVKLLSQNSKDGVLQVNFTPSCGLLKIKSRNRFENWRPSSSAMRVMQGPYGQCMLSVS